MASCHDESAVEVEMKQQFFSDIPFSYIQLILWEIMMGIHLQGMQRDE